MKTRQFIVLLIAILLQPVICYCWWGYRSRIIVFEKAEREQVAKLSERVADIQNDIMDLGDWTLEVNDKLNIIDHSTSVVFDSIPDISK